MYFFRDSLLKCEVRTVSEWDVLRYGLLHGRLPASYKVSEAHLIIQCMQRFLSFLTHLSLCLSRCHGRVVIREGNATADTVCQPFTSNIQPQTTTKEPHFETGSPSTSPVKMTADFVLETPVNFSQSIPLLHATENKEGTVNDLLWSVSSITRETFIRIVTSLSFSVCLLCVSVSIFISVSCTHCRCCWRTNFADCHCSAVSMESNTG